MVDVVLTKVGNTRTRLHGTPDQIIDNSTTVTLQIRNIVAMDIPFDSPVTTLEFPEHEAQENFQIKLSGNSASVTITWKLGVDAETPFTSGVSTAPLSALDIAKEISEKMVSSSIDSGGYKLTFPNGWILKGHVDNFTFHIDQDAPEVLLCTFRMTVGTSLTTIDVDDSSPQGDDSG